MKKLSLFLAALLLVPALARAQMYSISDVRKQAEALGRWTRTYTDKYGREVAVDVAPIVPEADKVPALQVDSPVITENNIYNAFPPEIVEATANEISTHFHCIEAQSGMEVSISIPDPEGPMYATNNWGINIQCQQPKPDKPIDYSNVIMLEAFYHMPDEIDEDTPYLGGSDLTVREALAQAESKLSSFFPDYDLQLGLYRFGVTQASPPYYSLDVRQNMHGIPILQSAQTPVDNSLSDETLGFKVPKEWHLYEHLAWGMFNHPGWHLDISDTMLSLLCTPLRERAVLAEDLPLCGMDTIIQTIQEQIEAGYIRNVFSLRFGYCCYFDEDEDIVLYPVWQVECDYMFNPKKNMTVHHYELEGPVTTRAHYRAMVVNAQTGEFMAPAKFREHLLDCPSIITWEDIP